MFSTSLQASQPRLLNDAYDEQIQKAIKEHWPDYPDWKLWKAQLFQESTLDPLARSKSGAKGLAQFMPKTWSDITRQLGWSGISAIQAGPAIEAGAFYMAKLRHQWRRSNRTMPERHKLAEASYNAGIGNILAAQTKCENATLWADISACLIKITGPVKSQETLTYVQRIAQWRVMMEK